MQITDPADILADNQDLAQTINRHVRNNGWHNTAKVMRKVVSVYVGWASNFTELDNVLRRIERNFEESPTKDVDSATRLHRSDIPDSPPGPPHNFS